MVVGVPRLRRRVSKPGGPPGLVEKSHGWPPGAQLPLPRRCPRVGPGPARPRPFARVGATALRRGGARACRCALSERSAFRAHSRSDTIVALAAGRRSRWQRPDGPRRHAQRLQHTSLVNAVPPRRPFSPQADRPRRNRVRSFLGEPIARPFAAISSGRRRLCPPLLGSATPPFSNPCFLCRFRFDPLGLSSLSDCLFPSV